MSNKKGPVKFKRGVVESANNKNVENLSEALSLEANAGGCAPECCFGILHLPNWNTTTNEREDCYGGAIIDGVWTVDTIANLKATIQAVKDAS